MAKSFKLDDSGDGDTVLALCLLVFAMAASVFAFRVYVPGLPTLYPAPVFVWLAAHLGYKRHYSKRLAAVRERQNGNGNDQE